MIAKQTAPRSTAPKRTADDRQPGDLTADELVARMIRVDHAGEYGAARIYEGQLAVLGRSPSAPAIAEMAEQEKQHLASFDKLIVECHVRPTLLTPLWHGAGFALGAASALLGEKAAMACTVAVEEVISDHYADQAERLGEDEADLKSTIEEFRADEISHRDIGLEHAAKEMPGYVPFTAAVKAGTRLAIWLSERI